MRYPPQPAPSVSVALSLSQPHELAAFWHPFLSAPKIEQAERDKQHRRMKETRSIIDIMTLLQIQTDVL